MLIKPDIEYDPTDSTSASSGGGAITAPVTAATAIEMGAVLKATLPAAPSFVSMADAQTWCAALRTALINAGVGE